MRTRRIRPAFTLAELLVVIALVVLLIAVAVPAFRNLLDSSDRALAENQLRAGVLGARDLAIRTGTDSAVAFFFVPGGRARLVPCTHVGTLTDYNVVNQPVERDIFVPIPLAQPTELPRGYAVRGYAPPGSIDNNTTNRTGWYGDDGVAFGNGRKYDPASGNWVFPETGFYNADRATDGELRQSFVIRFAGGTGELAFRNQNDVLIVSPAPSTYFRTQAPWNEYRLDTAQDQASMVRRMLADPRLNAPQASDDGMGGGSPPYVIHRMLGDRSSDTVLARPVRHIALADERVLATSIRARGLNRATGSLYGEGEAIPTAPVIDSRLFNGSPSARQVTQWCNDWIGGSFDPGDGTRPPVSQASLFSVERYSGQLKEISP